MHRHEAEAFTVDGNDRERPSGVSISLQADQAPVDLRLRALWARASLLVVGTLLGARLVLGRWWRLQIAAVIPGISMYPRCRPWIIVVWGCEPYAA